MPFAIAERKRKWPSVGPYCRASDAWSCITCVTTSCIAVTGKAAGFGKPPAKLIISGRSRSFSNSRISEALKRPATIEKRRCVSSVIGIGCWLLVVGCWLLVVGCWLLVVGCWLLVVGCWLLVARVVSARES